MPTEMQWKSCPTSPTPSELADWVELMAILDGWPVISLGKVRASVEQSRTHIEQEELDTVMRDLRHRSEWGSDIYPFARDGSGFRRRDDVAPWPYLLLVVLSNPLLAEGLSVDEAGTIFELICIIWAKEFLGARSKVAHFSPKSRERPTRFPDAIKWLARQLGLEHGQGYTPTSRNDGGVDFVAWVPFSDTAISAVVLLCQATVRHAFLPKASDIDARLWGNWINFLVEPTRVLLVPHVVSRRATEWTEIRDRGVALVDRRRLCQTLSNGHFEGQSDVRSDELVLRALAA